jgi:hypothetical protein
MTSRGSQVFRGRLDGGALQNHSPANRGTVVPSPESSSPVNGLQQLDFLVVLKEWVIECVRDGGDSLNMFFGSPWLFQLKI